MVATMKLSRRLCTEAQKDKDQKAGKERATLIGALATKVAGSFGFFAADTASMRQIGISESNAIFFIHDAISGCFVTLILQNIIRPHKNDGQEDPGWYHNVDSQKGGRGKSIDLKEDSENGENGGTPIKSGSLRRHKDCAATCVSLNRTLTAGSCNKEVGQMQGGHLNSGSSKSQNPKGQIPRLDTNNCESGR